MLLLMPRWNRRIGFPRHLLACKAHTANPPFVNHLERKVAANASVLARRTHAAILVPADDWLVAGCTATATTVDWVHGTRIPVAVSIRLCARSHINSIEHARNETTNWWPLASSPLGAAVSSIMCVMVDH